MSQHLAHHPNAQSVEETPGPHESDTAPVTATIDAIYKLAEAGRVLKNATASIEKLAHQATGKSELTLMHCLVLIHLSRSTACKQVDLKSATGIAPAYLTKLVDELHHGNLVCRQRSSCDRRQIILALTDQGRETAWRLMEALNDITDAARLSAIELVGASLEQWVDGQTIEEDSTNKRI